MRLAIQLYGHLRSFDTTAPTLRRMIIEPAREIGIEVDVFIHTWDEVDAAQTMPHYEKNPTFAGRKFGRDLTAEIQACYEPRLLRVESQIDLTADQLGRLPNGPARNLGRAFRNTAHSFCSANRLRRDFERTNQVTYDLVLVTRPDILFHRPLNLRPFVDRQGCWQYFGAEDLDRYVFSTYINGVHAVVCPSGYVAGLDLVLLARPSVCDLLATWEDKIDGMLDTWPEFALISLMNTYELRHSYVTFEKDRCWTILRVGTKRGRLRDRIADLIYRALVPYLLKSPLYAQHTFTNVTTYKSEPEFRHYLNAHLDLPQVGWLRRTWRRLVARLRAGRS